MRALFSTRRPRSTSRRGSSRPARIDESAQQSSDAEPITSGSAMGSRSSRKASINGAPSATVTTASAGREPICRATTRYVPAEISRRMNRPSAPPLSAALTRTSVTRANGNGASPSRSTAPAMGCPVFPVPPAPWACAQACAAGPQATMRPTANDISGARLVTSTTKHGDTRGADPMAVPSCDNLVVARASRGHRHSPSAAGTPLSLARPRIMFRARPAGRPRPGAAIRSATGVLWGTSRRRRSKRHVSGPQARPWLSTYPVSAEPRAIDLRRAVSEAEVTPRPLFRAGAAGSREVLSGAPDLRPRSALCAVRRMQTEAGEGSRLVVSPPARACCTLKP